MKTGIKNNESEVEDISETPTRLRMLQQLANCTLEEAETFVPYAKLDPDPAATFDDPVRIFVSIRSEKLDKQMKVYCKNKEEFMAFFSVLELPQAALELVWEKMYV